MNARLQQLELEARELSPQERAELACFLLESLEPADQGDVQEAWRIEAERRLTEVESGKVESVPGDAVFVRARRRLG